MLLFILHVILLHMLHFKILDHGCEDALGEINFNIEELLSEERMTSKKTFPLENSTAKNPTLAVKFQLKVFFLFLFIEPSRANSMIF